ncbi:MAG: hypothetical protein ACLTYW_06170 [Collinsella sp.]
MSEEFQQHLSRFVARSNRWKALHRELAWVRLLQTVGRAYGRNHELYEYLGQGTTFTIRLPFEKCKRSEIPQAVRVDAGDGDALQGLRVLLVEDNDLNAEIAQFMLARAGAVVTHAKDGSLPSRCLPRARRTSTTWC